MSWRERGVRREIRTHISVMQGGFDFIRVLGAVAVWWSSLEPTDLRYAPP